MKVVHFIRVIRVISCQQDHPGAERRLVVDYPVKVSDSRIRFDMLLNLRFF